MLYSSVMKITYIGQTGRLNRLASSDEKRMTSLATLFANQGHNITIFSSQNNLNFMRQRGRVAVIKKMSFYSEKSGGLLHCFLSYISLIRLQPDVVHIYGWPAATLVPLAALIAPEATFVWTVCSLPSKHAFLTRFIAQQARHVCDAIVTPTREIQYTLLTEFGVRTTYIPDGYQKNALPAIPASHFDLRNGQYAITWATSLKNLEPLLNAYQASKTKKKLVIATNNENAPIIKKLIKKFPFIVIVPVISERPLYSLFSQSALTIFYEQLFGSELLLQTMASGKAIIATNYPLHQEVLGTAGQFVKPSDSAGLTKAISDVISHPTRQASWGKKASTRAQNQFKLKRVGEEYETLYHYPRVKYVRLDSIQPATWKQSAI